MNGSFIFHRALSVFPLATFATLREKIDLNKAVHRRLNRFRAKKRFNSGIFEGFNLKWKLTARKYFGLRTMEELKTASFHQLGELQESKFPHRFC